MIIKLSQFVVGLNEGFEKVKRKTSFKMLKKIFQITPLQYILATSKLVDMIVHYTTSVVHLGKVISFQRTLPFFSFGPLHMLLWLPGTLSFLFCENNHPSARLPRQRLPGHPRAVSVALTNTLRPFTTHHITHITTLPRHWDKSLMPGACILLGEKISK